MDEKLRQDIEAKVRERIKSIFGDDVTFSESYRETVRTTLTLAEERLIPKETMSAAEIVDAVRKKKIPSIMVFHTPKEISQLKAEHTKILFAQGIMSGNHLKRLERKHEKELSEKVAYAIGLHVHKERQRIRTQVQEKLEEYLLNMKTRPDLQQGFKEHFAEWLPKKETDNHG